MQRAFVRDARRLVEVIDAGRRGEDVASDATLEQHRRIANVSRHIAGIINHDVPGPAAFECPEPGIDIGVAVTGQLLDAIAKQAGVVAAIEPELVAAEGSRAEKRSPEDLQAWELVARALPHFWKFTAEENAVAISVLRAAVEQFPDYAPANSILSFALSFSAYVGWSDAERELAEQLAKRAMEIDEHDPWAHVAVGFLAMTDRQTEVSLRCYKRALELNPNFAAALGFVGFTLVLDGQCEEALDCFRRATHMSPKEAFTSFFFAPVGAAYYLSDEYDEAIRAARQAVQLRPGHMAGYRILAASLAQAGQLEEAREVMKTLTHLQPGISGSWIKRSVPYTDRPMEKFLDGMRKAGLPE